MAHLENSAPSDSDLAAKLLREAGALALSIRADGLATLQAGRQIKANVSDFATAADLAAETHIFNALRAARPLDSILGEEGAGHVGTSGRTWVIDPVDGTYNFTSGSTYWCSALALVRADAPSSDESPDQSSDGSSTPAPLSNAEVLLGAVFQPEEDKLWLGGTTVASTLNGDPLHLGAQPDVGELSAATYIHPGWLAQPRAALPWQKAAELPATLRMLGSGSCDLARVSQGELGVWFQHSVPSWDWLPGKGIVEAAGGDTAVVRVNGLDWCLAGPRGAVAELATALRSGELPV
ncbi:fructose 1,6-bisphosphatase [Arthrobacter alpinus]|uniref:Fructose 1,6-bisphosphatase n=1 Tax=Arthrobacter alpinus TaxID=656366 RepID=A0A0S2M2W6_9MICC|nr:inositol monophosphatase family protein [Arthrobacter alpinus]ALO67998.1 fructose 1,6-bisphosphatase [Arthrobacter alpinus]